MDYILPRTTTKSGQRGMCFSGSSAWNSLQFIYTMSVNKYVLKTAQECTFQLHISIIDDYCTALPDVE